LIGAPGRLNAFRSAAESPLQLLVNIILVINTFVCVALIAVVLLQRSEGGALGMGGGGGPSGFMTARGAGDLLTRTTWILAGIFFVLSITLTVLTGKIHGGVGSLVDHINVHPVDLQAPQKPLLPAPVSPTAPAPGPTLSAPAPQSQTQAPAQTNGQNNGANGLSILAAPAPAPAQNPAPAQPPAQAPEKK
jgi:preprotein translocase subunit SecG